MAKKFYPLIAKQDISNDSKQVFKIGQLELLLIAQEQELFLIENKCGHFGAPLEDGRLIDQTIACTHHGISFDLKTGQISNRPWENCDAIKVFEISWQDNMLGVELEIMDNG